MRGTGYFGMVVTTALLLPASSPAAPSGEGPEARSIDNGHQVRAHVAVQARYERLRQAARPPTRPGFRLSPGPGESVVAQGRLHSFYDGIVMLAISTTPEQRAVLLRVGARKVASEKHIRNHTLFDDHYFQELPLAPPAHQSCAGCADDRLVGPDPQRLARRIGERVKLELRRDRDGRSWVVDLARW